MHGVFHQTAEARRVLHMSKIFSRPRSNSLIQIKMSNQAVDFFKSQYLIWNIVHSQIYYDR